MPSIRESIEQFSERHTLDALREAVSICADRLAFDAWVYLAVVHGNTEAPFLTGSLPAAWYARHVPADFDTTDPALAYCRNHVLPRTWNRDSDDDASDGCPRFLREATGFDLHYGINVPVHNLGCQWGVVTLASSHARELAIDAATIGLVQFFAAGLHEAAHGFATTTVSGQRIHLTAREQQCLHWSAEGKTGWEISKVLGISERTVVFHLENAARKLGVFGRRQAVARAIALQMIAS